MAPVSLWENDINQQEKITGSELEQPTYLLWKWISQCFNTVSALTGNRRQCARNNTFLFHWTFKLSREKCLPHFCALQAVVGEGITAYFVSGCFILLVMQTVTQRNDSASFFLYCKEICKRIKWKIHGIDLFSFFQAGKQEGTTPERPYKLSWPQWMDLRHSVDCKGLSISAVDPESLD